ncbi:MAG TPA: hypothetical protein VK708_00745 [Bryobacteraceae bacterium]|nr:hypothetical protein [Bryobacteraceae bacterium]
MTPFRLTALAFAYAAALGAAPVISGIYNAASWLPPSLPNSGVAQGAIFTLTGTGLGPGTLQQAESYPLPVTQGLGGTTVQVNIPVPPGPGGANGGFTVDCIMVYASATQVAAILPSITPQGAGTLTLFFQGGSSSIEIDVVPANFGTLTLNEGGTGPAVVTDPSFKPITMINAAHPGDTLILWGTGLGPVMGIETEPPTQVDLGTGVQVLIGNQPAKVTYGGRGNSPGLDQINFVVPAGVSGCKTSIAVIVHGVTGNVTTTSIAPAGQTTCGDTFDALTTDNLQKAITTGTLNIATVALDRIAEGNDILTAQFQSYPLNSLIRSYGGDFGPSIGSCLAYEFLNTSLEFADPIQAPHLDAGSRLAITGPGGSKDIDATSTGFFSSTLATQPSVYIEPGPFSVGNGTGGTSVGPFNWSLTLPGSVVPTNIPTSINRSQDLTLAWSGGAEFPVVSIIAFNGIKVTPTLSSFAYILCTASGAAGTFTIPSAILSVLPANGFGTPTEPGVNLQIAGIASNRFSVAGSPGIDAGIFSVFTSNGKVAKIQ